MPPSRRPAEIAGGGVAAAGLSVGVHGGVARRGGEEERPRWRWWWCSTVAALPEREEGRGGEARTEERRRRLALPGEAEERFGRWVWVQCNRTLTCPAPKCKAFLCLCFLPKIGQCF